MKPHHLHRLTFQVAIALVGVIGLLTLSSAWAVARADTSYTVQPGDTLTRIARQHNTTVESLVAANKAKYPCLADNPSCLRVGWVLTVPGGEAPPAPSGPGTYVVQNGDSLARIARKLGIDFNALVAANTQAHPCLAEAKPCPLRVGWVLNVPGGSAIGDDPVAAVYEYVAAINARDTARFKAIMHPQSPGYDRLDKALSFLYDLIDTLGLKYEVKEARLVERAGDEAKVVYVIKTTSTQSSKFKSNDVTSTLTLRKFEGRWTLLSDEVSKIEFNK